ncbi:nucleoside 2-deoxyribosyltransferase [Roseibium sp. Sym1]|uniref:nucleoside 2-deoxyribosyltransferase n=1 Tax=Roseibium sp. Sym1 TaxID=3016006 RepID=UPI003FA786A2
MKYYISGALQATADLEAARQLYDETALLLEKKGVSAYLPHRQTDPVWAAHMSSDEVFLRDLNAIKHCTGVVVFLNEPSHGVGAEVAMCLEWTKPILPLLQNAKSCSRFLEGLLRSHGYEVVRYQNTADLDKILSRFLETHLGQDFVQHQLSSHINRS